MCGEESSNLLRLQDFTIVDFMCMQQGNLWLLLRISLLKMCILKEEWKKTTDLHIIVKNITMSSQINQKNKTSNLKN